MSTLNELQRIWERFNKAWGYDPEAYLSWAGSLVTGRHVIRTYEVLTLAEDSTGYMWLTAWSDGDTIDHVVVDVDIEGEPVVVTVYSRGRFIELPRGEDHHPH